MLNFTIANLKGHGEHSRLYGGHGGEGGTSHLRRPRVLAGEGGVSHSSLMGHIELEVDEALGEEEKLALLDGLGEELVLRGDKTHIKGALLQEEKLGAAGVDVRRVEAAHCVVNSGHGNSVGVEPWEFAHIGQRHNRPKLAGYVARLADD
ncbi:hypothetical protein L7F22_041802 [Adiantum nelumboides]|nr:hypothetical protein [Adiantum nelumboides]